ncbi:MAG: HD-GYP domain-containing protein [Planctomycetota bacterium]
MAGSLCAAAESHGSTAVCAAGHPAATRPHVPRDALARELSRCQAQLNLVFELTAHTASRHDPDVVQGALLRRYAAVLNATGLFLDRGGCCMQIALERQSADGSGLAADHVRGVLAAHIELARRGRRTLIPRLDGQETRRLVGRPVLLATLLRADSETGVIVALREPGAPAFDPHDIVTSDAILAYGAQVLGNVLTVRHLQRTALETVCTLVNAIDAKDNYTSNHSERVGALARLTGEAAGLSRARVQALEWAGLLHDVGKIGVPEHVLNKPGPLTGDELAQMQRHARIGYEMLKPVAQFRGVLAAVLHHHENHDGTGYPDGLAGEQVPLEARIIHVVDIFDALTTDRPYRRRYGCAAALDLLQAGAARVTDPGVTRLFQSALRQYAQKEPADFRARFAHLAPDLQGTTDAARPGDC